MKFISPIKLNKHCCRLKWHLKFDFKLIIRGNTYRSLRKKVRYSFLVREDLSWEAVSIVCISLYLKRWWFLKNTCIYVYWAKNLCWAPVHTQEQAGLSQTDVLSYDQQCIQLWAHAQRQLLYVDSREPGNRRAVKKTTTPGTQRHFNRRAVKSAIERNVSERALYSLTHTTACCCHTAAGFCQGQVGRPTWHTAHTVSLSPNKVETAGRDTCMPLTPWTIEQDLSHRRTFTEDSCRWPNRKRSNDLT